MKLKTHGKSTSEIEVSNISIHGFWLYVNHKEYFLPFDQYPWFKDAKINEILNVQLLHQTHLYWPQLDIDLDINTLKDADRHPLVYK